MRSVQVAAWQHEEERGFTDDVAASEEQTDG